MGLLYCSGEPNSVYQVEVVSEALTGMGYTCANFAFTDVNDLASVTQSACDSSDVIYIPTDNTAANNTEAIANVVILAGVPVVAGEEGICSGCGVVTLSISYYDIGVYITYRILDVADLTVDGSLATGGAACVLLALNGVNIWIATLCAILAGMLAGLVTGLLHTRCGIPAILAGILTQLALYSVNLRIMGWGTATGTQATLPIRVDNYALLVSSRHIRAAGLNNPLFLLALLEPV